LQERRPGSFCEALTLPEAAAQGVARSERPNCASGNGGAAASGEYSSSPLAQYLLVLHDLDESPELIASARA